MESANLEVARRMLRAIESGNGEELSNCLAANAVQIEHPNRLKPRGDRRGRDKMLADFERGKALLASQTYEIVTEMAMGDLVALQLVWRGVLAVDLGGLKAGDSMATHSGIFIRFENGLIAEQHNYDCFEAF